MDSFLICIRPFFLSALNMIPYEELYPTPIHTSRSEARLRRQTISHKEKILEALLLQLTARIL